MNLKIENPSPGFAESILLMSLLISLTALSIDTMLPALPEIGRDLGVQYANDVQLIISMLILGLSIGQLVFGPLSDSMGRKPVLFAGVMIFIFGCALCLLSSGFMVMLIGRIVQGIGVAGPRSIVLALIRDQYEGRSMARMMSSIMSVFIMIPAVAPSIGQGILMVASWRAIFGSLLCLALFALAWFVWRQPETLLSQYRIPFSFKQIARAFLEVCTNRIALGYTIVAGFVFGAFLGYLNSAQQIFQEIYGLGSQFPIFFGILALSIGVASFLNSRIVIRFGMRKLTDRAMKTITVLSMVYLVVVCAMGGVSPLWMLMACLIAVFFCIGILFGNLNSIAMKPMGHIAGTASAVIGSLSSFIAVPISVLIGRCYNGTTLPLIAGFTVLSILSIFIMRRANE
jgi:DHA1 family bicyclomycin/chloramphenicol resistance-like MFS transporter